MPYLAGGCFLTNKKVFDKIDGFVEDYFLYGEDIDLGFKVWKLGGKIFFVPEAEVCHEFHGSSSRFSPWVVTILSLSEILLLLSRDVLSRTRFGIFFNFILGDFFLYFRLLLGFKFKAVFWYLKGTFDFIKGRKGKGIGIE